MPCSIASYGVLVAVSAGYPPVTGKSLTCYAPFRRSPSEHCCSTLPLDLHVLSLPLAFILSQDQTLLCIFLILQVRLRHSQFLKEINALDFLCCWYLLPCTFVPVFSINSVILSAFRRSLSDSPNSSQVLSEVPLFRNGIAKVGTFSEPANFSRTFFHFFFFTHPYCIILSP